MTYGDVTLDDLWYFFIEFVREKIFESSRKNMYIIQSADEWVKAVKISCCGDISFILKKQYRQAHIHRDHKIYGPLSNATQETDLLPNILTISRQLGPAPRLQRLTIDPVWRTRDMKGVEFSPYNNAKAKCLMLDADIENENGVWGTVMADGTQVSM